MPATQPAMPTPRLPAWLPADGDALVREEVLWRMPGFAGDAVRACRWTDAELRSRAPAPVIHPGFHVAAVALRGTAMRLGVRGETVHDGHVAPGAVQLTPAGAEARALFQRPSDFLHVYLPRRMTRSRPRAAPPRMRVHKRRHDSQDPGSVLEPRSQSGPDRAEAIHPKPI